MLRLPYPNSFLPPCGPCGTVDTNSRTSQDEFENSPNSQLLVESDLSGMVRRSVLAQTAQGTVEHQKPGVYRFADHVRPRTNGQSQPLSIYPWSCRMESSVLAVPVQQISVLACALTWVGCDDWRLWVPSFSSAGHLYSSLYDS